MIIRPISKEISINKLKDLFGVLKHTYSEIYIDEYGVVRGLSNYEYIIATAYIRDINISTFNFIKGRYISLNKAYDVLKDLKKRDAMVVYDDSGDIIGIIDYNDIHDDNPESKQELSKMKSRGAWFYKKEMVPSLDVLFEKYDKYNFLNDPCNVEESIKLGNESNDLIAFKTLISSGKIFNGKLTDSLRSHIGDLPSMDKTFIPKPERLIGAEFKRFKYDETYWPYRYWCVTCSYDDPQVIMDIYFRNINLVQ